MMISNIVGLKQKKQKTIKNDKNKKNMRCRYKDIPHVVSKLWITKINVEL